MADKKKMGNLLIGMRLALRQPLTSALPTASGTMLPDGLVSKNWRECVAVSDKKGAVRMEASNKPAFPFAAG
jgi:hypothetical protein